MHITSKHQAEFESRGFTFVSDVLDTETVASLGARYTRLFDGEFETGVVPDEVNWQSGRSDPTLTRQICNGWKADRTIAATVLDSGIAEALAALAGWDGIRLVQDNVLWKTSGARSLGFHRDNTYSGWYTPSEMITCWIALDETSRFGGTVEFAVGSHLWPTDNDPEMVFHAPDDYRKPVETAARRAGADLSIEFAELHAGSVSVHHGWTWHGSGPNRSDNQRRALAIHCAPATSQIDPQHLDEGNGPLYRHYWDGKTNEFPEEQFPVLWHKNGYRSDRAANNTTRS